MAMKIPVVMSTRLVVGLVQGLALLVLYQTSAQQAWPASDGLVYAPLLTIAIFIPTLVVSGLGNLHSRSLALWTLAATIMCAGLAVYDIFRDPIVLPGVQVSWLAPFVVASGEVARIIPSAVMLLSLAAILFIAHTLVLSGEADRRFIASYATHFDVAWKHGVQLVLCAAFLAVFWGLLFLGAELFRLIQIEFFADLIRRKAFSIPVSALALSYAIHVTDVRANIVQGARTLALILLSWLLPLMAAITAAFIAALPFTGLEPLWATKRATGILLTAAAALVFLINAAYQDGRPENRGVAVLRYASVLGAIVLAPLIGLAAYALLLRIGQYGLTPERVGASVCVVIAACYGLGYIVAVGRSGALLRGLERTNFATSLVIVGLLFVLRSPIADPDRISVADQISRLNSGRTSLGDFDFAFLRFRAGRYGAAALQRLAAHADGPEAADIETRAREALQSKYPFANRQLANRPVEHITAEQRAENITVIEPDGAKLPDGFLRQDWITSPPQWFLPRCLVAVSKCVAVLTDIDGDGRPDILLFNMPAGVAAAFGSKEGDSWSLLGMLVEVGCPQARKTPIAGHVEVVPPLFKDIEIDGQRLRINVACTPTGPAPGR